MTVDDYSLLITHKTRMAELHDIAAMDRLAAELAPPSALHRWTRQHRTAQENPAGRPGPVRRLFGTRSHHA